MGDDEAMLREDMERARFAAKMQQRTLLEDWARKRRHYREILERSNSRGQARLVERVSRGATGPDYQVQHGALYRALPRGKRFISPDYAPLSTLAQVERLCAPAWDYHRQVREFREYQEWLAREVDDLLSLEIELVDEEA